MTKENFIEIRKKYNRDIDCIKAEKFNKEQFYLWKQEFGISKRSKKDQLRANTLDISKDKILKLEKQFKTNKERADVLNISVNRYAELKRKLGISRVYDHSEIQYDEFKKLYDLGKNDKEIAEELNTNNKRICAYRTKLGLKNNVSTDYKFTSDEQYQIFIGGMYGDSCLTIRKPCKNYSFSFAHSMKQEKYTLWKWEYLKEFCPKPTYSKEFDKRNSNIYLGIKVTSRASELFSKFEPLFYKRKDNKRIKYINKDLLWTLEPLGIAVWFMDDGYKNHYGYSLATNCFSEEDLETIIEFFEKKYNIRMHIHSGNVLYVSAKDRDKLTLLIKDYIQPELEYKLHPLSCENNSVNLENSSDEDNPNPSASEME